MAIIRITELIEEIESKLLDEITKDAPDKDLVSYYRGYLCGIYRVNNLEAAWKGHGTIPGFHDAIESGGGCWGCRYCDWNRNGTRGKCKMLNNDVAPYQTCCFYEGFENTEGGKE